VHTRFWWGDLSEGDYLGDPGVDGYYNGSSRNGMGMDWIELAQDMDSWRALVNAVMHLWVP
jgi:hypothetical protein